MILAGGKEQTAANIENIRKGSNAASGQNRTNPEMPRNIQ
jgi:hypothetical protein